MKRFSNRELSRFADFVASPYYNKNKKIIDFFNLLKPHAPAFPKNISKNYINNKMFGTSYSVKHKLNEAEEKRISSLCFNLLKLIDKFWALEQHLSNDYQVIKNQSNAYFEKGLAPYVKKRIGKQLNKLLAKAPYRDLNYYELVALQKEIEFYYIIELNNRKKIEGIQAVLDTSRQFYLSNLLKFYCAAINRESVLNEKYEYPLLPNLIKHIKDSPDDFGHDVINIYYNLLLLLKGTGGEACFRTCRNVLLAKENLFPHDELRQMYGFLIHYLNLEVLNGNKGYAKERFGIFKYLVQKEILTEGLTVMKQYFAQIIKRAVEQSETEWATDFFEKFGIQFKDDNKAIFFLGQAILLYGKNDLLTAKIILEQEIAPIMQNLDFFHGLYARLLAIKICFDLEDSIDESEAKLNALTIYISRKRNNNGQISTYFIDSYHEFQKLASRLFGQLTKISPSLNTVSKIKEDIENLTPLEERAWLSKKADQLLNRPETFYLK